MTTGPEKDRPGMRSGGIRPSDLPAATPAGEHPPEELLEVLVIAAEELSTELHVAICEHARSCVMCRSVLGLLLQYHRAFQEEAGKEGGRPPHPDALVRAIFTGEYEENGGLSGCGESAAA